MQQKLKTRNSLKESGSPRKGKTDFLLHWAEPKNKKKLKNLVLNHTNNSSDRILITPKYLVELHKESIWQNL